MVYVEKMRRWFDFDNSKSSNDPQSILQMLLREVSRVIKDLQNEQERTFSDGYLQTADRSVEGKTALELREMRQREREREQ